MDREIQSQHRFLNRVYAGLLIGIFGVAGVSTSIAIDGINRREIRNSSRCEEEATKTIEAYKNILKKDSYFNYSYYLFSGAYIGGMGLLFKARQSSKKAKTIDDAIEEENEN